MIVPTAYLLTDLCAYLSARDIRAIACVDVGTSRAMRTLMVQSSADYEAGDHQYRIIHTVTSWPKLNRTLSTIIRFAFNRCTVEPNVLPSDYTGMIYIRHLRYARYYIFVSAGMVDCHTYSLDSTSVNGIIYVPGERIHFAKYAFITIHNNCHPNDFIKSWKTSKYFTSWDSDLETCVRRIAPSYIRAHN